MKTAYLNPYGQSAHEIIHKYGNITQITTKTQEINNIIKNTPNQKHKQINTIKDLCHDKIRQHLQDQYKQKSNKYNYLYNRAIDTMDTIATHTLLQATAINYGHESSEADLITQIITNTTRKRIETTTEHEINRALTDYLDIHNTIINDILPLLDTEQIKLNQLVLSHNKIILTYEDFITEYTEYLQHRNPETMYTLLCHNMKKNILTALIQKQTRHYLQLIESQLKKIEPAQIIKTIAEDIKKIEKTEQETRQKHGTITARYTSFNDDRPTAYIPEAFPPCIQKALRGIKSGGRNCTINMILTPFLSYARLYPGVYAKHKKNPRITDMDPTLTITTEEIIPKIHQAAQNCKPPLFKDQPTEKQNIHSKLGFGEGTITYENCGKTPWYTPPNCKNIKQQQPGLCTPSTDCTKIGNPLSYYNRKRKLLTRKGEKKDDTTTSNMGRNKTILSRRIQHQRNTRIHNTKHTPERIRIRPNRTRTKRQIQPIHTNQVPGKNNKSQSTICSIQLSSTI